MKLISLIGLTALLTLGAGAVTGMPAQAGALMVCPIGGCPSRMPGNPTGSYHPPQVCHMAVGHLPDLTPADIVAITDWANIKVVPICPSAAGARDVAGSIETGNVHGLKGLIDRNRTVRGKLFDKGFRPAEVMAIVPTPHHGARIYVEAPRT